MRPYELEIVRRLLKSGTIDFEQFRRDFDHVYGYEVNIDSFDNAVEVLEGKFVSKGAGQHDSMIVVFQKKD